MYKRRGIIPKKELSGEKRRKALCISKTQCGLNNLLCFCVRQVEITPAKFLSKLGCFAPRKIVHLGIYDDRSNTIGLN